MKTGAYYLKAGAPFQLVMIVTFLIRRLFLRPESHQVLVAVLTSSGLLLFIYCLYVLYIRTNASGQLITSGVFTYTRHPMYTAFFLMDSSAWFAPRGSFMIISSVIFLATMLLAGRFQEYEVLARFGQAGKDYYQRTPRLFIWYPFGLVGRLFQRPKVEREPFEPTGVKK